MSYLDGKNELIAFKDIRKWAREKRIYIMWFKFLFTSLSLSLRSILKSEQIHISVTKKPAPDDDKTCTLNVCETESCGMRMRLN